MNSFPVKFALAIFIIASLFISAAQAGVGDRHNEILRGTFSGSISDAVGGQPLAGVSIYFADIKMGVTTNVRGEYLIRNIPEGHHLIEISHIGYNTIVEDIDFSGDIVRNYILQKSVVENNAVIVTGVGATQLKKAPYQVSILQKRDLWEGSSGNIIEALAKRPGVSTISTGPAISKPVIRGLGYNRILTINDGVRQEGQQWGDEHGIEIDESSVTKVEILKGPASLIYGSDALAGVINILTHTPVENNTIKANILSIYQTNNNAKTLNANLSGNINGFNWNLYGSAIGAADYQNRYDGPVFNSKYTQKNYGGYAGYNGSWGYSHLLFSNFNLQAGLVEGERDSEGYFIKPVPGGGETRATADDFNSTRPQVPFQHIRHFKIASDNNFKLGKKRLSVNIGYQRNQREEFGNVDDLQERSLFFDLTTLTYTARLNLPEINGWASSAGINGMAQNNKNRGLEQLIPDYNLFDFGAYVYTKKSIKKITLSGGLRYDNRNLRVRNLMDGMDIKETAFNRSFGNISGSLGLAAALSQKVNIKLNLARGFRAPGIPELASNGAHEGTNRYEYGNNNLNSEISTQIDAGVEFNTEHLSFGLGAYRNAFSNFIFYRKLAASSGGDSLVDVDGSSLYAFKFDQQNAILTGLEATVDIHPHPLDWLHVQNTFSLVSGRFKEKVAGNRFLPFMPSPRLITEIRGDFKKLGNHLRNFYTKIEMDNTFKQDNIFAAYDTETPTNGYTLVNAATGADFTTKAGKTLFSVNFIASNLGDVAYQNHLSRLKYSAENLATGRNGVFNMGRNFTIKLNVPLNFSITKK